VSDGNILPPHVVEARLQAKPTRHQDGRSWECRVCTRVVNAVWSDTFSMWLPASGLWAGRPNIIEHAYCSGDCATAWRRACEYRERQTKEQQEGNGQA